MAMRLALCSLCLAACTSAAGDAGRAGDAHENARSTAPRDAGYQCPVTIDTRNDPPEMWGNESLGVVLYDQGRVVFAPGGPGFVLRDGALSMKFGWVKRRPGPIGVTGRRLDGDAPPLRARISEPMGKTGGLSSYLSFPTPGCWEVTGRVGEHWPLTFVTLVVKIGEGPPGRGDW